MNIKDFEKEEKKRQITEEIKKTAKWAEENKDLLIVAIPIVGAIMGGLCKTTKGISRNIALKQEKRCKELFIYDRSLGAYLELKKPLSQQQMKTILERKENGEKTASILRQMNLLK